MSYDLCLHVDANDPALLAFAFVNARNYLNGLPGKEFELVLVANGPAVKLFVPAQAELQKTGASVSGTLNAFRVILFLLTFFTIGMVSNFRKLMEEGIGRLAIVYVVCLFGFIIWLGLFISWLFFHGMTPPLAS